MCLIYILEGKLELRKIIEMLGLLGLVMDREDGKVPDRSINDHTLRVEGLSNMLENEARTKAIELGMPADADEEQMNEHLLSSFISAVNSFASSTFKTGTLDRIKSGDFTLLINSNNNLMFVYIFRGYSYYGMPKLNYLADKLSELSVLNEVKDKYSITNNEKQILETEIMKVISAQYDRI